jgi:hypothetical protein
MALALCAWVTPIRRHIRLIRIDFWARRLQLHLVLHRAPIALHLRHVAVVLVLVLDQLSIESKMKTLPRLLLAKGQLKKDSQMRDVF